MNSRRVLLVDDDPVTLLTVGTRLRAVGYEVVTHEGSMGVYNVATRIKPDVAIIDVNMPGISGEGVVELLRTVRPRPLLMLYSSLPEEELKVVAARVGAAGYATKAHGGPSNLVVELRGTLFKYRDEVEAQPNRPPLAREDGGSL